MSTKEKRTEASDVASQSPGSGAAKLSLRPGLCHIKQLCDPGHMTQSQQASVFASVKCE